MNICEFKQIDKSRIQVDYILIFSKNVNATNQCIVKKCHSCGASMDVNNSGKCSYCGSIYKQEQHDYILTSIKRK